MIGFSQANDLSEVFTPNSKDRPMADWTDQISSTNNFCNEIDEMMKHEYEDVILHDDSLSIAPLDLDLESISDLLENPSSTPSSSLITSNFTQPLNINDLPSTFTVNNNNRNKSFSTTTTTSTYSSLGISPQFTTLSLNNNPFQQYFQSNNLHLPTFTHQQDNSVLGTSYPLQLQTHTNGSSDVKRFRSASMNDGPSSQQHKLNLRVFDPYSFKSPPYIDTPSVQNELSSSSDVSLNSTWCPRPPSNSFSEVENQQQQRRLRPKLSSSFNASSNFHHRKQTSFQPQTLYAINQSNNEDSTPPTRKRSSLGDFPEEENRDDRSSPSYTIEQQSEPDLWSDIEQNSSDHMQDDEIISDNETTVSSSTNKQSESNPSSLFWQYNVQSKGPKTKRILYLKERDPHLHREFSDPVYQIKLTQTQGHTFTKLRKGDGNDVTPNPLKLYQLGKQIRDLSNNSSSLYHGIYHVDHHTNNNDTAEVKKEKNKIASRACRLRKKAQHEANKVKLHGLNEEHKALIDIIASMKAEILKRYQDEQSASLPSTQSLENVLDQLIVSKLNQNVAGNSDGFVRTIINDMELLYTPKPQRSYSLNT
ncbi:hypothetical protein I4U23_012578 [Adineta vaga]|nr:hypothetical protein I4U23_012578 [Adineta vaga]